MSATSRAYAVVVECRYSKIWRDTLQTLLVPTLEEAAILGEDSRLLTWCTDRLFGGWTS